jgi:predicted PurR-regulated permease PerM
MVVYGIVGLFVGAVVLAVGYQFTVAWVKSEEPAAERGAEPEPTTA